MPVHDRHEVEEPTAHRNIRHVRAPHMVRPRDRDVSQQVREDLVFRVGTTRVRPPIYRLQAHLPHQTDDSLPVDPMSFPAKHPGHLAGAEERHVQEDLVQSLHQRQILRRLAGSLVVERRAAKTQQAALPRNSEPRMVRLRDLPLRLNRSLDRKTLSSHQPRLIKYLPSMGSIFHNDMRPKHP